ncbi:MULTISPECIES: type II secretion system F family protein [Delftia]|uniref:Type II secretion system F family protein n=2 Tax=Delftia TaxID=80865 RepID=A0A7T2VX36_DELAC|nr:MULTISPECIES: type II secretion system F family protein [Delftia]MBB1651279.1 type II secretion system protein F [Delftia sp. UME58]QPS05892.1 type II secretion system F family protein [Delftia acidovorans]
MPDYSWEAVDSRGQMVKGTFSAAAVAEVVVHLRKSRLSPIKVEEAASLGNVPLAVRALKKGRIKADDIQGMTTELAIMMRAGLSLDNALKVLVEMSHKVQMQAMLQSVLDSVKAGMPLSQALGKHHDLFGDFYINMVRSGEASGQMSGVLNRLVEHMARQRALRDSVVSATIYPAILLGVAVLSLVAMLGFVVPQFEQLFNDMGDALPLPTQFVMGLGHAFRSYGWAVFIVLGALGWVFSRWAKSPKGRQTWQSWLLGLPGLGGVVRKYQLTLFSRSLGTLLGNGVTLLTALRIASDTVSNVAIRERLEKMGPMVKEGHRMAHAAQKTGEFEPLALNLVRVGEETGRLGDMMLELSNILNREVENAIKRLLTMLEPALILVLGILIASIIVSILLGILSVNDLAV